MTQIESFTQLCKMQFTNFANLKLLLDDVAPSLNYMFEKKGFKYGATYMPVVDSINESFRLVPGTMVRDILFEPKAYDLAYKTIASIDPTATFKEVLDILLQSMKAWFVVHKMTAKGAITLVYSDVCVVGDYNEIDFSEFITSLRTTIEHLYWKQI